MIQTNHHFLDLGIGSCSRVRTYKKDPGKRQYHYLILKILFMVESPKLFMMAIFDLINRIGNSDLQNSA